MSWSDACGVGVVVPYNATQFRVFYIRNSEQGIWSSSYFPMAGYLNLSATIDFEAPIQGWNANFNPLLSMPLVDIGHDVGEYAFEGWSGVNGHEWYSTTTPSVNTLGNLATVEREELDYACLILIHMFWMYWKMNGLPRIIAGKTRTQSWQQILIRSVSGTIHYMA